MAVYCRFCHPFQRYTKILLLVFLVLYIFIFSHSYPIGILYVSHSNGPIFFHIGHEQPPMGLLLQHRIVEGPTHLRLRKDWSRILSKKSPPILAQKKMTPKTLVNAAWIFGWHLAMRQVGGQRNQGRGVQIHRFVALPQPSGSNVAHDDMGLSDMFKRKTSEFHG